MMIMTRSAYEFWSGKKAPPEVHSFEKNNLGQWTTTTWQDVFKKRKEKQDKSLSFKRDLYEKKIPCYVWVFHNGNQFLFGGWYVYVVTKNKEFALNFKPHLNYKDILLDIMKLFPCGVLPMHENFELWCEAFCSQFPKKSKKRPTEGAKTCYAELDKYNRLKKVITK